MFGKRIFVQACRKSADTAKMTMRSYRDAWARLRTRVKPAIATGGRGGRGVGKGRGGRGRGVAIVQRPLPPGELTHTELKPLTPPLGSLWKRSNPFSWNARWPPSQQVSASVHLHGHREAALICLRELWDRHLFHEGKMLEDCPIRGLFPLGWERAV